jgi:SAM-dependent MidA family methyltransferase
MYFIKRCSVSRPALAVMAGFLSATCLVAPPAPAQKQNQNAPEAAAPERQSPSPTISNEKLDAAAAAVTRVASVKQNYQQQLTAAPPADRDRISGEANNAIQKAVTDQGLSVDEYNSIMEAAQNNPTLRQQLVQRIRHTE